MTFKMNDCGGAPTFYWCICDVFGALFTAAAWRCELKIRRTLKNWTCFLHAREFLSIAQTFNTWILCECHLTLLKDVLPVQVAA